jgi:hypothetical protein
MTNLELVAAELAAAKKKHPKFVDSLLPSEIHWPANWYDEELEMSRRRLEEAVAAKDCHLHHVLQCEAYEAFAAYAHGDLAHARQELAQCAAVCIRAMEHVEKEMEETK